MPRYPKKAHEDQNLFPVIEAASMELRTALASVLATKSSSSIDVKETGVAALTHELQLMGGNTLANVFRRSGVTYRQIVTDAVNALFEGRAKPALLAECELAVSQEVVGAILKSINVETARELDSKLRAIPDAEITMDSLRHLSQIPKAVRLPVLRLLVPPFAGRVIREFSRKAEMDDCEGPFGTSMAMDLLIGVREAFFAVFGAAHSVTIPAIAIVHLMRLEAEAAKPA